MILLPRQARDKHRERALKTFSQVLGLAVFGGLVAGLGAPKNAFASNDHFTKTGSGQTNTGGKAALKKEVASFCAGNGAMMALQVKKRSFCAIYIQNTSFYQDRLGTDKHRENSKRDRFSSGRVASKHKGRRARL